MSDALKKPKKLTQPKAKQRARYKKLAPNAGRAEQSLTRHYQTDHLKPYQFTKGQSGNPSGMSGFPAIKTLTKLLKDVLNETADQVPLITQMSHRLGLDPVQTTIGAVLATSLIANAIKGNVAAIKEVFNRVEGRVALRVEVIDPSEVADNIPFDELMTRVQDAIARNPGIKYQGQ